MGMTEQLRDFLQEEEGSGVIEVLLIIVVIISLVLLFKNQLTSLVGTILSKITSQANGV